MIYNSRNYIGIIADYDYSKKFNIYNSRNYIGIIADSRTSRSIQYLQ